MTGRIVWGNIQGVRNILFIDLVGYKAVHFMTICLKCTCVCVYVYTHTCFMYFLYHKNIQMASKYEKTFNLTSN